MPRWTLTLVLFLSMSGSYAVAQDTSSDRKATEGGAGFFAIGMTRAGLGTLNDRLDAAGYPTFGTRLLSFGGGGYTLVGGRVLIGGEGHGVFAPSETVQGRDVTLGGGYGLATVGYLAVARSGWQVYPQVGVGLGGVSVEIGSADGANFDDVLDAPNREARLNRGQLLASLALHATYTLGAPEGASGFRIGLQVGYLFAPAHGDWTMGGHTLPGGPEAGLDGAFFRLLLGGGSLVQGGP